MPARATEFSDDNQAKFDRVCEQIADGKGLRTICKDETLPSVATVMRWLNEWPEIQEQYARAREAQADTLFDEILEIADDALNDYAEDGEGGLRLNSEHVQRSRLRVDARKWAAGKLRPKKYGDKVDLSSSDGTMTPKAPSPVDAALATELAKKLLGDG